MEIKLETMDAIMDEFWNDDEGEFSYHDISGRWELVDVRRENDDEDGDIEQYVFNITIFSIDNKKVKQHYIYRLNNLQGENELEFIDEQ